MAKNLAQNQTKAPPLKRQPRNAFRRRDWETLTVAAVFLLSLLATIWMVLVSVQGETYRIIPAASLLALVELWLIVYLPFYGKLAFWGALIFIGTYLFFAVPAVTFNILTTEVAIIVGGFIVVSLLCLVLLFRQRALFLVTSPSNPSHNPDQSNPSPLSNTKENK